MLRNIKKPKNYFILLICIVISLLFYGNSIQNGYSLDDELVTSTDTKKNEKIEQGFKGFANIFSSRYAEDGKQQYAYRPVTVYSFAIEYDLFGNVENRAAISHIISILLYALSGYLLFVFLQLSIGEQAWRFNALVVLLFLIHPIHSEVVNNIKSRDELLAFLFGISLLIHSVKFYDTRKKRYLFFSLLFIFLAIFSKETGTIFLALVPVSLYFFRDIKLKHVLFFTLALAVAYISYKKGSKLILNQESIRYFSWFENPLYELGFASRIPMFFYSICRYILLLILPYPLKYYYGYNEIPLVGYSDPAFYVSLLVILVLLYFTFSGIRSKKKSSYFLLFFFLGIGGAGNLLLPLPGIIAERFAFVGSVGFCALLVYLLFYFSKTSLISQLPIKLSRTLGVGLSILFITSLVYSFQRNKDWESTFTLYHNDISKLDKSMKANSLLATEYAGIANQIKRSGNIDQINRLIENVDSALLYYTKALAIYDQYANTYNNIGFLLYNQKSDITGSIPYWQKALQLEPDYQEARYNIANSYGKIKKNIDQVILALAISDSIDQKTLPVYKKQFQKNHSTEHISESLVAWEVLNHLEQMANSIWSQRPDPGIITSYGKYANAYITWTSPYLESTNAHEVILSTCSAPDNLTYARLRDLFDQLRRALSNKILNSIADDTDPHSAETLLIAGSSVYRDSFYNAFEELYRIDPQFSHMYNAVAQFASANDDPQPLITWGRRFAENFPDQPGGGYRQAGAAFRRIEQKDSATFYFNLALNAYERELQLLRSKDQTANRERINQLVNSISLTQTSLKQLEE